MKKPVILFSFLISLLSLMGQGVNYETYPVYKGTDLGLTYSSLASKFKIWSPVAEKAQLIIYENGTGGEPLQAIDMRRNEAGTWAAALKGNQKGKFYVFRVMINNEWLDEVPDPYAKIVGANGKRAMVGDLKETNPAGWQTDKTIALKNATDAIIYELHVRDASIALTSGIQHKGKFLGLTEKGTKNSDGLTTGLDHLKELGVTHIHLLPFFDYNSVDETKPGEKYNWGYDPLNYNAAEGSYATDPYDGLTRIKELKQLIKTFHANGLNVVMDVVYNHTALTEKSYFNQLVPGYYYRQTSDGKFSNATACGNETASEKPMVRKFILESMIYWVKEYHVDGFRVDLMGVHDIETMNIISKELHKIKPGILIYGEGWTAGSSPLPDSLRALKKTAYKLDNIAVFSDDIRDGIKGSVFDHADNGFASGKAGMEESIKFGVVAACKHPQIDYSKVNYSKAPYAAEPYNTISYCECHDNHTLWDKLSISAKDATEDDKKKMQKLAIAIVLTSQGISFLHAGTEFLRSKKGIENSFESPDSINAIDWNLKTKNKDVFNYVKALIKMRKAHPAFRMTTTKQISSGIRFVNNLPEHMVAYAVNGAAVKDAWRKIFIVYNGSANTQSISLPQGKWNLFDTNTLNNKNIAGKIEVSPWSCTICYQR